MSDITKDPARIGGEMCCVAAGPFGPACTLNDGHEGDHSWGPSLTGEHAFSEIGAEMVIPHRLSARAYFAAACLSGAPTQEYFWRSDDPELVAQASKKYAKRAVMLADALLKELGL